MFDKIRSALGLGEASPLLAKALTALRADVPGRYDEVLGYVQTGEPDTLLMKLSPPPELTAELVSHFAGWTWWDDDVKAKVKTAVPGWTDDKNRAAWRKLLTAYDALAGEQWVRLGRFMSLFGEDQEAGPLDLPVWARALWEQVERAREGDQKPWTAWFLETLLHAGGVDPAEVPVVLIRGYLEHPGTSYARPLGDIDRYALANLDAVRKAAATASIDGRLAALDLLQSSPELLAALQDIMVFLVTSKSKQVRDKTLMVLTGAPEADQVEMLTAALSLANATTRPALVDHLSRTETGRRVLQDLAETGDGQAAEQARAGLERAAAAGAPQAELVVPECPPLEQVILGEDFVAQLRSAVDKKIGELEMRLKDMQRQLAEPKEDSWTNSWLKGSIRDAEKLLNKLRTVGPAELEEVRAYLSGQVKRTATVELLSDVARGIKMDLLPAMWLACQNSGRPERGMNWYQIPGDTLDVDLRLVVAAGRVMAYQGIESDVAAYLGLGYYGNSIAPEHKWPFFAEYPDGLEEALGMRPASGPNRGWLASGGVAEAIEVLGAFPVVPASYVPRLSEIALGTAKTNRLEAQKLLERQPSGLEIARLGLSDGKAEVRSSAAAWLARIGDPAAIPDLRAALKAEKREAVQAVLLSALDKLGDDISSYLSPEALLEAASKGLKAKAPADAAWLPLLPSVRWADGSPVDPDIVRWWAILSVKMKDPTGAGLIPMYVSLLDEASQAELGRFVLDAWIAQDIRRATDEEAREFAAVEGVKRYNQYQAWAKNSGSWAREYAARPLEQVIEEVRKEKLGEFLGSAIGSKGVLALAAGAPGHYVLTVVQRYMRDQYQRRSQIEALITAASVNDDPAAIQLVIGVARRHKMATIQAKAGELVEALAARKGWTADELADRTIPSAGFDDAGVLNLDYGPRQFTGRITVDAKTGAYGVALTNADGKPVKSLPAPGASDDAELVKAARAQLTTSKKELKQVVEAQTSRLFEAMCLGRTWPVAAWREDLLSHPVMRQLVSNLVWVIDPGEDQRLFRPTVDGELLDADDETVDLPEDGKIGLAHWSVLPAEQVAAWQAHMRDYQVKALFDQFEVVELPERAADATAIDDHAGWLSDSFAIRGRANKRGYARGEAMDGGWFDTYRRPYTGVGLVALIEFTGSYLPEEQIPAAVTKLSFERTNGRSVALGDVPPILLAESYRDYVYVAEAGAYDPDWKTKAQF